VQRYPSRWRPISTSLPDVPTRLEVNQTTPVEHHLDKERVTTEALAQGRVERVEIVGAVRSDGAKEVALVVPSVPGWREFFVDDENRPLRVPEPPFPVDRGPASLGPYRLLGRLIPAEAIPALDRPDVFLACTPREPRVPYVVKAIRPGSGTQARLRFHREVSSLTRARGAGVVRLVTTGEESGIRFLVLAYVEGMTLKQLLASGPLPQERAIVIAAGLLSALGAVHDAGVTHFDVKPGNVIVASDGRKMTLIDFGASREHDGEGALPAKEAWGTLRYLDRARLLGEMGGPTSDLFAWAVTVVEAATGRHPFNPRANSTADTDLATWHGALDNPPDLHGVPAQLEQALRRALTPDPGLSPTAHSLAELIAGDRTVPCATGGSTMPSRPASGQTRTIRAPVRTVPIESRDRRSFVYARGTVYPPGWLGRRRQLRDSLMPVAYRLLGAEEPRQSILVGLAVIPLGALTGVALRILWSLA
jgi:serine/threonine protein kinase